MDLVQPLTGYQLLLLLTQNDFYKKKNDTFETKFTRHVNSVVQRPSSVESRINF